MVVDNEALEAIKQIIKSEVTSVKEEVTSLKSEVTSVKEEVTSLKSEVTSVKEEVTSVKEEVTSLKSEVTFVKEEVTSLKSEVTSVKEEVTSLKSEVTSLKRDVRTNQLTLENEIIPQIKIIAEGHSILNRKLDTALTNIAKVEDEREQLRLRLIYWESEIAKIKERLSELETA